MTAAPVWEELRYFRREEFRHPEAMDPVFLRFLHRVREHYGDVMLLTSDGRTPAANAAAVGHSDTSLHLFNLDVSPPRLARAVDFRIRYAAERYRIWEQVWHLDSAIRKAIDEGRNAGFGVEFEPVVNDGIRCPACGVVGPSDRHFHLGLFPDQRPHRLVLSWT
jgi:hypothetical protein